MILYFAYTSTAMQVVQCTVFSCGDVGYGVFQILPQFLVHLYSYVFLAYVFGLCSIHMIVSSVVVLIVSAILC